MAGCETTESEVQEQITSFRELHHQFISHLHWVLCSGEMGKTNALIGKKTEP
jgi:hypothetical protein